jgi:hypothetical protein
MRHENQPWNQITATIEIVVAGVAQTGGAAVQCSIKRRSDGQFLANGGGSWAAGYAQNLMAEVDAANTPGLYQFAMAPADAIFTEREYLIEIKTVAFGAMPSPLLEFAQIEPDRLDWLSIHRALFGTNEVGAALRLTATANDGTGVRFTDSALLLIPESLTHEAFEVVFIRTGGAFIAHRKITKINTGAGWFEVDPAIDAAGPGIAIGDTALLVRTPVVTTAEINVDGIATVHAVANSEIRTSGPGLLCTTVDATGLKFYDTTNLPAVARSADFLGRLGVFTSPAAWAAGGAVPTVTMVRIGGIANDGGGDHMLFTKLDGTAIGGAGVALGDGLIVLNSNDFMPEEHFDATMSGHSTTNTFGDYIRRMLGIRQKHMRSVYSTFNGAGQPLTGIVLIYNTGVDLDNDTGPGWALATGRYDFTATYDGSGRLTEYKSKEIS